MCVYVCEPLYGLVTFADLHSPYVLVLLNVLMPHVALLHPCRYYFYNQGTGGVKGVLKNASIADIDSVQLQITTSKNDVIATLAGRFVLR